SVRGRYRRRRHPYPLSRRPRPCRVGDKSRAQQSMMNRAHTLQMAAIALLVNPANTIEADIQTRELQAAARALDVGLRVLHATDLSEIEEAFATVARERRTDVAVKRAFYRLADEKRETILAACSKCEWRAAFSRDDLIASHGSDYPMPN